MVVAGCTGYSLRGALEGHLWMRANDDASGERSRGVDLSLDDLPAELLRVERSPASSKCHPAAFRCAAVFTSQYPVSSVQYSVFSVAPRVGVSMNMHEYVRGAVGAVFCLAGLHRDIVMES